MSTETEKKFHEEVMYKLGSIETEVRGIVVHLDKINGKVDANQKNIESMKGKAIIFGVGAASVFVILWEFVKEIFFDRLLGK